MFLLNSVLARCISKGILLKAKRKVCLPFNYNCYLSHGQQMSKFSWKITREKVLNSGTGNVGYSQSSHGRRSIVLYTKGEVTRDDSQRRFLAKHSAMLQCCSCNHLKQYRNNVATLCCGKNRRCQSSRVTSPWWLQSKRFSWDNRHFCLPLQHSYSWILPSISTFGRSFGWSHWNSQPICQEVQAVFFVTNLCSVCKDRRPVP